MRPIPALGGVIAVLPLLAALGLPASGQSTSDAAQQETSQPETSGEAQQTPAAGATESQTAPASGATPAEGAEAASAKPDYVLGDVALGDPEAPVTVIEYASFTCPHCASFHMDTWPKVKEAYVDTGKVRFILREVYFDQYGLWASMVARCGGEEGFYPMVDAYLTTQPVWTRAPDIGHAIQQVGRRAGLSSDRLSKCLSDREFAKTLLAEYQENREADDVQSTPTFIIAGEKHVGAKSFEEFSELLDGAL